MIADDAIDYCILPKVSKAGINQGRKCLGAVAGADRGFRRSLQWYSPRPALACHLACQLAMLIPILCNTIRQPTKCLRTDGQFKGGFCLFHKLPEISIFDRKQLCIYRSQLLREKRG